MTTTAALSIKNLCKTYPSFALKDVSFALEPGTIAGFIGRNGAGKSTTLKSLINFVHPDDGEILFFGKPFLANEFEIKQRIGFVMGGVDYYPKKKLSTITQVTKRFYKYWDDAEYRHYLELFALDERKTPHELSEGMKVKYSLALALSHHAELLILDEPTSGLDPVSRDDLLDVFLMLARERGISILFSTHITTDLEKCADRIVYIKNGEILADDTMNGFLAQYKVARFGQCPVGLEGKLIGQKQEREGYSALVHARDLPMEGVTLAQANLEAIMVHMEKEGV